MFQRSIRRGSTATQTALLLPVLMGSTALTIDLGHMRNTKAQLQFVIDAAAHSAVLQLDGSVDGPAYAVEEAVRMSAVNGIFGESVGLDSTDITLGYWDDESREFSEATFADPLADAIRIETRQSIRPVAVAQVFLGGDGTVEVTAVSIAHQVSGDRGTSESGDLGVENGHVDFDGIPADLGE